MRFFALFRKFYLFSIAANDNVIVIPVSEQIGFIGTTRTAAGREKMTHSNCPPGGWLGLKGLT